MFASKLLVVAGLSLLVGVLVGVVTVGVSAVLTTVHGQPLTGLDQVAGMAARGSLLVLVLGVLGFCIGLLTGSTAASTGVLLGGIFVLYVRTVLAFSSRWAQHLSAWSPEVNLQAILNNGTTYLVSTGSGPVVDDSSEFSGVEKTVSLAQSLGYWAVLLALLIAVDLAGVPAAGRHLTAVRSVSGATSRPRAQRVG